MKTISTRQYHYEGKVNHKVLPTAPMYVGWVRSFGTFLYMSSLEQGGIQLRPLAIHKI